MLNKAKIEQGRALVLVGPQGCGKTRLARKLAAAEGSYLEIDVDALEGDLSFLENEPKTCIVRGMPLEKRALSRLKTLISQREMVLNPKHRASKTIRSPNFIFCTNDQQIQAQRALYERRFQIVGMPHAAAARLDIKSTLAAYLASLAVAIRGREFVDRWLAETATRDELRRGRGFVAAIRSGIAAGLAFRGVLRR